MSITVFPSKFSLSVAALCRSLLLFIAVAIVCSFSMAVFAQEVHAEEGLNVHAPVHEAAAAHAEHAELTQDAVRFYPFGKSGFAITNSMIVTWIAALGIILFARYATKQIREVPEGAQNFWEWLVEGLHNFLDGIIGHKLAHKTFWFFATVFIFILATNWIGLIPGVGTIGWGAPDADGVMRHIANPIFRGANADMNLTFAMSAIFFVCWTIWAFQANGPGGFLLHIFGPKGNTKGVMKALMVVIFGCVGLLEVVSILFRPISLGFRLYGNVFAGETMLEAMTNLVPVLGWLIPIPFYFMELMVGIVQAFVFMLLTAVFTLLICTHEEGHEAAGHH